MAVLWLTAFSAERSRPDERPAEELQIGTQKSLIPTARDDNGNENNNRSRKRKKNDKENDFNIVWQRPEGPQQQQQLWRQL